MSKLKLDLSPLKLLLAFLIISLSSQASIPPEKDFKALSSREISFFELTKTKSEAYYSFDNQYADSDLIINFKIGKGFTSYCYIYDSYDKIKQDDKGQYINALKDFQITENTFILKNSDIAIKKLKYFIVIKDIINSFNKDYISIFNENETIELGKEQYVEFNQFFSKNIFLIKISPKKNEIVTLQLNIDNADFSQIITITSDSGEIVYIGEKNRGEIKLNEELESSSETYMIEIESQEEPYTKIKSSLVLHLDERKTKELKYDKDLSFTYNGNMNFLFYLDLSEYDLNEENIITFKFGKQIKERNLLSHCYAKAINLESNDDNKLIANMPAKEQENEATFSLLTGAEDVYQLYFKNTKEKVENKTTYLLIHLEIKINDYDTNEFLLPEEFSVYLSNKPEKIDLAQNKDFSKIIYNKNIQLKNYVPIIYKILLPLEEQNLPLSYVFYTSESIQTIYNVSMLSGQHSHEKYRMLYALSPTQNEYEYTKTLYIKIYGLSSSEINFRIESTESNIYYIHNDYRKIKTFSNKLTDCSKSFYYLGDYGNLAIKGYFYQETLYGNIETYYKGKVSSDDQSILINHDPKYKTDSFFSLDTNIDIVELKCDLPGFYQAHLVDNVDKRDINLYSKVYNYIPAKKNFIVTPLLSPNDEDINLEIYTPTGKNLKISDGEKTINLDNTHKYYQNKYTNSSFVPKSFTLFSDEDNIISITLTNKKPFIIVDTEKADIDYDSQIIIKLPQKEYSTVNVEITRIYHGFSYSLFKGNVEYAGKLIESEYDYIKADKSHKIRMKISNPYLAQKNEISNDENDVFYLMYSIDDPEQIQKEAKLSYNPIEHHDKINPEEVKMITDEMEVYDLPTSDINIIYQSCENSLKEILIKDLGENIIQEIPYNNDDIRYNYNKINNYKSDSNINLRFKTSEKDLPPELKGAIISITEKEVTPERINYYTNLTLEIKIEDGKLKWKSIEQMKNYDIYVLDQNNSYIPYLKNPCLLELLKNNYSAKFNNDEFNNSTYIKHYSSNVNSIALKEQGIYIVIISSKTENDIPLIYISESFIYNSSLVPPPSDGDDDDSKGTAIFLGVALPLVVIGVAALIYALLKCTKKKEIDENIQEDDKRESIIRETTNTRITSLQ